MNERLLEQYTRFAGPPDLARYRETFATAMRTVFPPAAREAVVKSKWNAAQRTHVGEDMRYSCPLGVALYFVAGNRAETLPSGAASVEEDLIAAEVVTNHPLTGDGEVVDAIERFVSYWDYGILEPDDLPAWFAVDESPVGNCIAGLAVLGLVATVVLLLVWDGQWIVAILVILALALVDTDGAVKP
jgi:hypothetical protein